MKILILLVLLLPILAYAIFGNDHKNVAVTPNSKVAELIVSREIDKGPQDVTCRSGGVVYYEHKNVLFYTGMVDGRLYEVDTKEKIIVPMKDCMFRPHKK